MTYKFVGALRGITTAQPHIMKALKLGVLIGLATEILRKLIKRNRRYLGWAKTARGGRIFDFILDAFLLPSPYASSFMDAHLLEQSAAQDRGASAAAWRAGAIDAAPRFDGETARRNARRNRSAAGEVPPDMSTTSLVGGGLIAGDSLAALSVGIAGLLQKVF